MAHGAGEGLQATPFGEWPIQLEKLHNQQVTVQNFIIYVKKEKNNNNNMHRHDRVVQSYSNAVMCMLLANIYFATEFSSRPNGLHSSSMVISVER